MRRVLFPLLLFTAAVLTACGPAPDPGVTFTAGKHSERVQPLQYCDPQGEHCKQHGNAAGSMPVRQGDPVQISVDGEIASTPWQVEYRMLDSSGRPTVGCSRLFTSSNERYAYTVQPPPGSKLTMINIYEVGARVAADVNGSFVVFGRGTWTLLTNGTKTLPKPGENLCADRALTGS